MLRPLSLAVWLAIASSLALAQVPNAGLEEGQGEQPRAWSWRSNEDGKGAFVWDAALAHSGQRAARVANQLSVGYTALDSDFVSVEPGNTYRISAWVNPLRPVRRGVYFMITQHRPDDPADQLPNSFSNTSAQLLPGQWQQMSHMVEIRPGNTRLRIHCIQAFAPSEVLWDDFTVTEAGAVPAYQPPFEPPTSETVPPLASVRALVAKRPRARVLMHTVGQRPRLELDGRRTPFAWYVSPFGADFPQRAQIGDFARIGVHVYLVPLVLGRGQYGDRGPWLGKGKWDFAEVDELLWRVLRVDPRAYVIFYMACDPYPDWGKENPDSVTRDQNGLPAIVTMHIKRWGNDPGPGERFGPSPLSPRFRQDVAETLRRLAAHVEASEPGKAVIGYHVAGLNDGQWFAWDKLDPGDLHLSDYSPGAQEGFREWLQMRYGGNEKLLQEAWRAPQAAFATAATPPADQLWAEKVFLDPAADQRVIDWNRFYSEGVAETVQFLAGVLKAEARRPILCGTYYEDITCNSANHIALASHLASADMDYLAGPAAYSIRLPGFQGAVRNVFASTTLHGKMYLTEQDWRSWHSEPVGEEYDRNVGRALTAEAHNAMVRRECGMMLAFGLGTWWYDMSGGWFRDGGIMRGLGEALRAFQREQTLQEAPQADVAVFVSEESNHHVSMRHAGAYRWNGITRQIEEFNTAGVPYRLYLQSDLARMKLPDHKVYVFLNAYALDWDERRALTPLMRDGKVLVFVHGPNLVEGDAASPGWSPADIVGMKLALLPAGKQLLPVAGSTHPLLTGSGGELGLGAVLPGPCFAVTDDRATSLATYGDDGPVGAAVRDFGTWKSVFIGVPGISPAFLNSLAHWAGAWTAADPGDAVYASQHFLTIHAMLPGEKTLTLQRPSRVTDLTTGKVVSQTTDTMHLTMKHGETRWFYLEPR